MTDVEPLHPVEQKVLSELMRDKDLCVPVDCADPHVQFVVKGWFAFPKGSLTKPHDLTLAS